MLGASIPLAIVNERKNPGLSTFFFVVVGISGLGFIASVILMICGCCGFVTISPNEAVVYEYFGRYLGTVKDNGFFYGFPLASQRKVSLRSNQYNGERLKVNERDGNPVELGIIVVWRIGDTAKAIFDVVNYEGFIRTQSEAAIRYIGCKYPYEPIVPGEISLRGGHEIINKELRQELEKRVKISGIIIEDARVTEISYGAEVAKMMLQKQASNATVYAKDAIVKGAANAVMNSLNEFEKNGCQFTNEEKAKYVTSLMTTLCMSSDVSKIMGN
jgi:regulator of protease activity HflC (stomatin/prohibitin superfamily)